MKLRVPRSLVFWFGFFGLIFGLWLWVDSAIYSTGVSWVVTPRQSLSIRQAGGEVTLGRRETGTRILPPGSVPAKLSFRRDWNRHPRFIADFWSFSRLSDGPGGGPVRVSSMEWSVSHWVLMILYCVAWLAAIMARWFRDCLILANINHVERDDDPQRRVIQKGVRIQLRPVAPDPPRLGEQ